MTRYSLRDFTERDFMITQAHASQLLDTLLRALRFTKDIQLAEYLGVSAQAIYQARKKGKVPDAWLIHAARVSHISVSALLRGETHVYDNTSETKINDSLTNSHIVPHAHNINTITNDDESMAFAAEFVTIPLVAAQLSAGGGSLETESAVIHRMAFRRSWLMRKGNPHHMVLMRAHGDSMEPYIQHGDVMLVDTSKKNIIPYTVFAVGVDDGIYVKALETLPGQKLVLRSYNDNYAPIEIDMRGDLADSVRIIGKVLWWCHEV